MKHVLVFALVLVLLSASDSARTAEPVATPAFSEMLRARGLGHLTEHEMGQLQDILDGLNKATTSIHRDKVQAYDSVVKYMERQGYTPELVVTGIRDRRDFIIVGRTFREYTFDIPLSLTGQFLTGTHFVRKGVAGGATSIISDGEAHDLTFATWRPFR